MRVSFKDPPIDNQAGDSKNFPIEHARAKKQADEEKVAELISNLFCRIRDMAANAASQLAGHIPSTVQGAAQQLFTTPSQSSQFATLHHQ